MKVSVVIPAYNCAKYIEAAIRSVLCQTWTDLELIVVDDCSQDATAEIVEKLMGEDARVVLLKNPQNVGTASSRNAGVARARGEWVAFLDSDDLWRKDKLELQLALQNRSNADLIYSGARCIQEDGTLSGREFKAPAQMDYKAILRKNDLVCSSVLLRRELAQCHPFLPGKNLHEDYICWTGLLKEGYCAAGVQEPLVWYRLRKGSKSNNKLRSAWMVLRSYHVLGLSMPKQALCFVTYAIHGLRRYF